MTFERDLAARAARIETLLSEKLGRSRGRLPVRASKAGRDLPRWVKKDIALVDRALQITSHPTLRAQVAPDSVLGAADRAEAHLRSIDVEDRRRGRLLGMLGALAFNLLLLFTFVLIVLRWRGLV